MKRQGRCFSDIPSELAACGGEERKKDFLGTPQTAAGGASPPAPLLVTGGEQGERKFLGTPRAGWLRPLHPQLTQSVAALAPRWQAGWEPGGWGRIDYRYGVPVLRQYGSWHRKLAIAGP
jgi:hypothetical protein